MQPSITHILTLDIRAIPNIVHQYSVDAYLELTTKTRRKNNRVVGQHVAKHTFEWLPDEDTERVITNLTIATSIELIAVGQQLYEKVFSPAIREILQPFQDDTQHYLRLALHIEPLSLAKLPWEALHDGKEFLAVHSRIPLVRTFKPDYPNNYPLALSTLNVLILAASPNGATETLPDLKIEVTLEKLDDLFKQRISQRYGLWSRFNVKMIPHATYNDFKHELDHGYHILCFVGHAESNQLYFDDGRSKNADGKRIRGNSHSIVQEDFIKNIDGTSVRLVILIGCQTNPSNLPESQLPAIVSMQTEISTRVIENFLVDFIHGLSTDNPVEVAFTKARKALFKITTTTHNAIAPVLYLQAYDSRLFRKRPNYLLIALIVLLGLILVFLAVRERYNFLNSQYLQWEANNRVERERLVQFQTITQLAQRREFTTAASPTSPLVLDNTAWFATNKGIQHINLATGAVSPLISTGLGATHLVYDGRFLWVSNTEDLTVTRIDPTNNRPPLNIVTGIQPASPMFAQNSVWVFSKGEKSLTRITPETGENEIVLIDFDLLDIFVVSDTVWAVMQDPPRLLQVDHDTRPMLTFEADIALPVVNNNDIWLITGQTSLNRIDTLTLETQVVDNFLSTVAKLRIEQGSLWVHEQASTTVWRLDIQTGARVHGYDVGVTISEFYTTPNRLWITTTQNQVMGFDLQTHEQLPNIIEIQGINRVTMTADNSTIWFTNQETSLTTILRQSDGLRLRQFSPCQIPRGILFDGASMWFSCDEQTRLVVIPAQTYYFEVQRQQPDLYNQTPIVRGEQMWIVQEQSGSVILYNGQTETLLAKASFNSPLAPLVDDGKYLWTRSAQHLIRLSDVFIPRAWHDFSTTDTYYIVSQQVPVNGDIVSFDIIGAHIWIVLNNMNDLEDASNLLIINRHTLAPIYEGRIGFAPTRLTVYGDDVWLGAVGVAEGYLYRLNATTGQEIARYDVPHTVFAPGRGVAFDGLLWFLAEIPSVNIAPTVLFGLTTNSTLAPALGAYAFNPITNTWHKYYQTPQIPSNPVLVEHYLWFNTGIGDTTTGNIYALDTQDGTLWEALSPCRHPSEIYKTRTLVWVGCDHVETALWAFRRDTPEIVQQHTAIGSDPNPPLEVGDFVVFTFKGTHNIAVFDATSGELLRMAMTSIYPGPPFVYKDHLYVYHANGVLQTLSLFRNED